MGAADSMIQTLLDESEISSTTSAHAESCLFESSRLPGSVQAALRGRC